MSDCSIGPYAVNGVPLRRVNQKYVIATSTKVPLTGVDVAAIDDSFFARESSEPTERTSTYTSAARKAAQTAVDAKLTANVQKVEALGDYLKSKFSLSRGSKPHTLKF
jgi:large subunit ribosomal protein L6e